MLICKKERPLRDDELAVVDAIAKAVKQYALLIQKNENEQDGGKAYVKLLNAVHRVCHDIEIEQFTMMLEDSQNSEMRCPQ